MPVSLFPSSFYEHLKQNTLTGIKGGTSRSGFLNIWMVEVDKRVFARSWGKSERSWFTALQQEGLGEIQYGYQVLPIVGKVCTDPEINKKINAAYLKRYSSPENIVYAKAITQPEYMNYTMELIFTGTLS